MDLIVGVENLVALASGGTGNEENGVVTVIDINYKNNVTDTN